VVRFCVHKGLAASRKLAAAERFLGVMGMPTNATGEIELENLTLACRNAVLNMLELLTTGEKCDANRRVRYDHSDLPSTASFAGFL